MADLEPRNFLQPCLLLLLAERADHGYELASRMRPMHDGEGDPGGVYRALRGMEKRGLVRSEWRTSDVGPARRTYHITAAGLALLTHQARELQHTHEVLHVFLQRYAEVSLLARSHAYQAAIPSPRVADTDSASTPGRTRATAAVHVATSKST
jgi:PadR family transcriptional regulator, regulatory protein PadR